MGIYLNNAEGFGFRSSSTEDAKRIAGWITGMYVWIWFIVVYITMFSILYSLPYKHHDLCIFETSESAELRIVFSYMQKNSDQRNPVKVIFF